MEVLVGYVRRNFMVPMPRAASWAELNIKLVEHCRQRREQKLWGHGETIGERFARDRASLLPLLAAPYEACARRTTRASSQALVRYGTNNYSVPVRYGHRQPLVKAFVWDLVISCGSEVIARHVRSYGREELAEMAVYRPKFRDPNTGRLVEAETWWYDSTFAGRRIRETARTHLKSLAKEAEQIRRRELERAFVGASVEKRDRRVRSANEVVDPYLACYEMDHRPRPKSIAFAKGRLAQVKRLLGARLMPDLTEDAIRGYIAIRVKEGVSGRTINMEVGEPSRAIGKHWSILWPKVRKQEERKDIGRALSPAEESRLLEPAGKKERWRIAAIVIRALLFTGM